MKEINAKFIAENLHSFIGRRHYTEQCTLFYKGQAPLAAVYILSGSLTFQKRIKKTSLAEGRLHFVDELLNEKPLNFNVIVNKDSVIYLVDRFTLQKLIEDERKHVS